MSFGRLVLYQTHPDLSMSLVNCQLSRCHLSLVTWHDVIWETGTLSDRQLALEFFLFRFLLTLVKRNLDDRQFTSWIKEVNRLADSQSLFQYNHWKPQHYIHPNHQCGHKNLSITVIINHILCHVMNRWKSEYVRRTQFEGKEPRGREMDTGGKSQQHCNIFIGSNTQKILAVWFLFVNYGPMD